MDKRQRHRPSQLDLRSSAARHAAGLATALMLTLLACKSDPAVVARQRTDLKTHVAQLAALANAVPAGELGTKKCDDAKLKGSRKKGEGRLFISGFEKDALLKATSGTPGMRGGAFGWLNAVSLDNISKARSASDSELGNVSFGVAGVIDRGHVAIFRARTLTAPEVTGDTAKAGLIDGDLVIMNIHTKAPLCHVPILATNSPGGYVYWKRLFVETTPEEAANKDLRNNFQKAGTAAVKTISSEMVVTMGIQLEAKKAF